MEQKSPVDDAKHRKLMNARADKDFFVGGFLPHAIVSDNLSRNPMKFLCRAKCVSKNWRRFIACDPDFGRQYLQHQKRKKVLIYRGYAAGTKNDFEGLVVTDNYGKFLFRCSVNAFYYSHCYSLSCYVYILRPQYGVGVINPYTRESLLLPISLDERSSAQFVSLAMGYVSARNEYKILDIFHRTDERQRVGVQIITLREGFKSAWKDIGDFPYRLNNPHGLSSISVNQNLYWIVGGLRHAIVCLQLQDEDEQFRFLSTPGEAEDSKYPWHFSELDGFLCLVTTNVLDDLNIWVLKEGGWIKQYTIDILKAYVNPEAANVVTMLNGQDGEEQEIVIWGKRRNLTYYNLRTKSFRTSPVQDFAEGCLGIYKGAPSPYVIDDSFSLGEERGSG